MFTRKSFLTSGAALAAAGVFGENAKGGGRDKYTTH